MLEYLDFEHCKRHLRNKLGATLHAMPYRKIRRAFERRCLESGVPFRYVPPEYSSLVGGLISRQWTQLGRDQAAGVVLSLRASEEGNAWLEKECERAALAESVCLRLNAKGSFGHTARVTWVKARSRQKDSESADTPAKQQPLRWQRQCGLQIKRALSTLYCRKAAHAKESGQGTAPGKDSPPFEMPRCFNVDLRPKPRRSTLSKAA